MVTEFDLPYPPSVNHYFRYWDRGVQFYLNARTYRSTKSVA